MIPKHVEVVNTTTVSASLWANVGMALCVGSILAFAALQYVMPAHWSPLGLNAPTVGHFQEAVLGRSIGTLEPRVYQAWSRVFLGGAWGGYSVILAAGWMGGAMHPRRTQLVMAGLGLLMAFLAPPSLSTDVYAYVAYGRMQAYYGLNPYAWTPQAMVPLGDPTTRFIHGLDTVTVYGPVWTQLSVMLLRVMYSTSLWWQVTAFKIIEALALTLAAWLGGRLAARFFPGRGQLASLAIGLNPLLLIEGPINGHNDILMMALMLAVAVLADRGRVMTGAVVLGLSIGIKYLPLAVVAWLIIEQSRGKGPARSTYVAIATIVLALAPSAVALAPLWRGPDTFSGLRNRSQWGIDPQHEEDINRWITNSGVPAPLASMARSALQQWPVIDAYIALTFWLCWWRGPGRWLDAWVLLSSALIGWTCVINYPWYMAWPVMAALTRWDGPRVGVSVACLGIAVYMSFRYWA